jgi:alpha-mannosidase
LFIETEIDNQAKDHKLKVNFPTGLNPTQSHVDQAYLVLPRDIDLPESTGWIEDPTPLMHQRAFTSLQEDGHGLAILNRGLPAVEVTRIPDGTQISLIILRSVGWLSRDDLSTRRVAAGPLVPTPGAQCIGKYKFEYAILPHAGDWQEIYQQAYAYTAPLLIARADTHEGLDLKEMNITRDDPAMVKSIAWPREGRNPDRLSYLTVDRPELVISAIKRSTDEKGIIVRFFNIRPESLSARIKINKPIEEAWLVNLHEERQEQIPVLDDSSINVQTRGHQIITLEFKLKIK